MVDSQHEQVILWLSFDNYVTNDANDANDAIKS